MVSQMSIPYKSGYSSLKQPSVKTTRKPVKCQMSFHFQFPPILNSIIFSFVIFSYSRLIGMRLLYSPFALKSTNFYHIILNPRSLSYVPLVDIRRSLHIRLSVLPSHVFPLCFTICKSLLIGFHEIFTLAQLFWTFGS